MEQKTTFIWSDKDIAKNGIRLAIDQKMCRLDLHEMTGKGIVLNCIDCRRRKLVDYEPKLQERLVREGRCFACDFWKRCEAAKDDPHYVRIRGTHYIIGQGNVPGCKGFGGTRFIIEFFDGRRVGTDCLWEQGRIPPRCVLRLPDNAEFGTMRRGRIKTKGGCVRPGLRRLLRSRSSGRRPVRRARPRIRNDGELRHIRGGGLPASSPRACISRTGSAALFTSLDRRRCRAAPG
jgi:hypothetical protein